jgi:hypothetical protein
LFKNSLTNIEFKPNGAMDIIKETNVIAYEYKPKLDGPKYLATIAPTINPNKILANLSKKSHEVFFKYFFVIKFLNISKYYLI